MEFRNAVEADANSIMGIINQAQAYFKECSINQWQDNYPNFEIVINDINNNSGYVLLEDNNIVGTAVITFDGEKSYEFICNGKWGGNGGYAVIHRMAVDNKYRGMGLSSIIIKNIEDICLDKGIHNIRIDTHEENISMKRLLLKNGFQYCGIIYLDDKEERIALEKMF